MTRPDRSRSALARLRRGLSAAALLCVPAAALAAPLMLTGCGSQVSEEEAADLEQTANEAGSPVD